MSGWTSHTGKAVCLAQENIDTDQLIPARFMSQPRADGYADFLLYDMRHNEHSELKPDFILNQHTDTSVLLAGNNFGSGSSREAAVYALLDSGIRVVIATSYGDIFSANAVNNGVLPARVSAEHWQTLYDRLSRSAMVCTIDLSNCTINIDKHSAPFDIDNTWRQKLINGWDDTDITKQHQPQIDDYRQARRKQLAWAWPASTGTRD